MGECPSKHAARRGVELVSVVLFTSAPDRIRNFTISKCPAAAAHHRGGAPSITYNTQSSLQYTQPVTVYMLHSRKLPDTRCPALFSRSFFPAFYPSALPHPALPHYRFLPTPAAFTTTTTRHDYRIENRSKSANNWLLAYDK